MYSLTFYFYKTFYYMGNKEWFDKYFKTEIILISIKSYVNVILYVSKQSYLFIMLAKANMQGMACVFQCTERVGNYRKVLLYLFKQSESFSILLRRVCREWPAYSNVLNK